MEFHNILSPLVNKGLAKNFTIYAKRPIESSEDPAIHNLDSPINQHDWTPGKHSEKRSLQFLTPAYQEIIAVIDINGKSTKRIEQKLKPDKQLYPVIPKVEKRWSYFSQ